MRDIDRRWARIKTDLWAVYEWADMANYPAKSGGGQGQKGVPSDPVGEKATAYAEGHFDDPTIKGAKEADSALLRIIKSLQTIEYAISSTKAPYVMSDVEKEVCEGCGCFRFERPNGWTLGQCKSCYGTNYRARRRRN